MAIRNTDGSEFKLSASLQQFDPENPEHNLLNVWDQEAIETWGTPLFYYELFVNTSNIDELYIEARDKLWSQHPIQIYGYYNPIPSQNYMSAFGIDAPDELMIEFNYQHILEKIGHAPKIGARIYSPHKRENWVVIQRNSEEYKLWGEYRLQVMCERFQESLTTGEGKVTQKQPDFKLNSVKDLSKKKVKFAGDQPQ